MRERYLKKLTLLLQRVRPRLASTHELSFRPCFGAVAGYVDAAIFISARRFGTAIRLLPQ